MISVSNPVSMPAVSYDKVHMSNLSIEQPTFDDDAQEPVYALRINYLMYGVVAGVRYYDVSEGVKTISIPNYLSLATTKAGQGDMDLVNALSSIELAVANIIKDMTGAETVVA